MNKTLALAALMLVGTVGCRSIPPVVIENGPTVVRAGTSVGVRWALADQNASKDDTIRIRGYLMDAKTMLATGQTPAHVLDDLAAMLNAKITNIVIRQAIQYGIELVKSSVTIPVDGVIPARTKIWIEAAFDGAIDGCNSHIAGFAAPMAGPPKAPSVISFR